MPKTQQPPTMGGTSGHPYKTQDVAARYGLTVWGVRRLVRAGKLDAINIGDSRRRILRYSDAALIKFEREHAA